MTADGRISIAGLNTGNLDYIAEAFHKVTKGVALWDSNLFFNSWKETSATDESQKIKF